jgi:hypothetical protein
MPACASGSLYLDTCSSLWLGMAFVTAFTTGDKSDWFIGAVLLSFGVALMWKSARDRLDWRTFVLFIVRVMLWGAVLVRRPGAMTR